ncbi:hypothetical protein [Phaeobacter gallaeciensis]|uniref:hypothetical protein n=1 Tax=Phaeobacter gallaeciensis TaxID=60890 RepID=UPI00237F9967|nr:hypothetical protein [Phaeobacter gallaeciensis]MDE4099901.1 hypothetical protein [Phaeobacter gallaeciensis]MDE4108733.1 hypothetical protein [Phaeobacter gallaeciensis]MDE4113179.1 hypothetical protein [Phaeobacter gallaeciensis]MDE4117620.1 hypothetical protein [Phaeobacter gallaeciensis]MDE4122095.1 hypothetical protein [Phaeobacter gallaeciensis]
MPPEKYPIGDEAREAIDSLRGYVYQVYQSALAWTELEEDEFLFLEVAEDYAVAANGALQAVQVKETAGRVTINSDDIVASIDSFVELRENNPSLKVTLRHLTTSTIGKEKKLEDRVSDVPTLEAWRSLARSGDLTEIRRVLLNSKLSEKTKKFIESLDEDGLREEFLKRIHFDCGAIESRFLARQINSRISKLLLDRGGVHSQAHACTANILLAVLKLSTNPNRDERFVDRTCLEELLETATQVTLNRAQFEVQSQLMTRALSASVPSQTGLPNPQLVRPSPVSETPLPTALADRTEALRELRQTLETLGVCWISGAAGMGKTVASRILAHSSGGDWASINLRGQSREQVAQVLFQSADSLKDFDLKGLIIDDLGWVTDPNVLEGLCYLLFSSKRSDVLLVLNSADLPSNEFLFACDLHAGMAHTLSEFSEEDIQEILRKSGVNEANWAKYVHLISGGGHPQLAMASIRGLAAFGWDPSEFQTLNALLQGTPAVEDVRKRTRERLLNDLPLSSRKLIERLSLKTGGFNRELAVDLGKVEPEIPDAGIILETLVGSWVDQQESNRFDLSPLLSGYASKTLGSDDKKQIESAIADSLTKSRTLDVVDMNSALLAAWASENEAVIMKLCMAVLGSDHSKLEMLAPHLTMFTLFRTDKIAYPANPSLSQMFRGAQILLLNQDNDSPTKIQDALRCFSEEAANVEHEEMRVTMSLLVYSKLLLQVSKAGLGANFTEIISELNNLLDDEALPSEVLDGIRYVEKEGVTAIGFMFLNQARQLSNIDDLHRVFVFLDGAPSDLRSKLLAPFRHDDFEVDMLVTGAWLREHDNGTIDSSVHSAAFGRLEEQAVNWSETDLAVCCRKYQAIILDEYGNDKEGALAILDDGLSKYGQTNSELVRAKAKVLYRSEDHQGSLELSKILIEGDAPLSDVEKAFLGRDAAISAEKQGDFETARGYYLYGSDAAKKSNVSDMAAMRVGLLADAALASWHSGDRLTCLQDYVAVLGELNQFKYDETLRTAHCHAVARHTLLWLDQDATGEKRLLEDGEETKIYPGCVSNPEPHPEIGSRFVTPIEMAWYMLAKVENHAELDAGITENLDRFLPNGPVIEGQILLTSSKMHKAIATSNSVLFAQALRETVANLSYVQANGGHQKSFNIENPTYGQVPAASREQQSALRDLSEQFVLLFCVNCILLGNVGEINQVIEKLASASGFSIRPELLDRLQSSGPTPDFYTDFSQLVFRERLVAESDEHGTPHQMFELAFKALQIAQQTSQYRLVAEALLPWILERWDFVWERQRFLLNRPSLHETSIKEAIGLEEASSERKVVGVLMAILPTLGIGKQSELQRILSNLPRS